MDKVYPRTILLAAMTFTVSGIASDRLPRLPSSTYNVEIRPDNYYYHEQQLGAWFIQCYQRKRPAERYWHCNASDRQTIKRFRTTLTDPGQAFIAPQPRPDATTESQSLATAKTASAINTHPKTEQKPQGLKPTPHPATETTLNPLTPEQYAKTDQQPSLSPETITRPFLNSETTARTNTQPKPDIGRFSNPALEAETQYLLQLAAFQNLHKADQWRKRYPDVKTQIIKTQGKFTQWYNVVTAQPVEYIDALALSVQLKDKTGETPWIREKKDLL